MSLRNFASELRLYLTNHWVSWLPSHRLRLFYYRQVMQFEIGPGTNVFMGCQFDCARGIVIGKNTTINPRCRLDSRGGIRIGNFVSISSDSRILTADHDPDSPEFSGRHGQVVIGDHCFVGTGALILKGVNLGTGAIIGAGSVVTHNVPAGEIWAGNPARKIRDRKITEYNETPPYRRLFQ